MNPQLYWIANLRKGRLATTPRPNGEAEIIAWKLAGIDVVISLLTPEEATALGLQTEAHYCADAGINFLSCPIPDRNVPDSIATIRSLVEEMDSYLSEGKNVAIHCHAGIGRSSLLAACLLGAQGLAPGLALPLISQTRGVPVPETDEQKRWVEDFFKYLNE
jgi:protein-tyrosine phosphatase